MSILLGKGMQMKSKAMSNQHDMFGIMNQRQTPKVKDAHWTFDQSGDPEHVLVRTLA